ncbi:MAG: PIN domain-containing protein [Chloroflexota bacterium]|nr:PIN domain-containing protein [Chloroflexota bacterium]
MLRDTLLRSAAERLYEPRWSPDILDELSRNLVHRIGLRQDRVDWLLFRMEQEFPDALIDGYQSHIAVMTNHPKDRHVLAAAVHANAALIVTSNLKDYPEAALAPYNIATRSPDRFLLALAESSCAGMETALRKQAQAFRNPPRSVSDVLKNLERSAPAFVTFMRDRMLVHHL